MSQGIVIKVAPDGSTQVRTDGFTGGQCRQASQFIELALGFRQSEQLTQDFYKVSTEAEINQLQQGEANEPGK